MPMSTATTSPMTRLAANRISTRRRLEYVKGYLALGLLPQAVQELSEIDLKDRFIPRVVEARMDLLCEAKQWSHLAALAKDYANLRPGHEKGRIMWAYALREQGRVSEARAVLLDAEESLGENTSAILHYNLACYHCLLGELARAKSRLAKAFRLDEELRFCALKDADLQPLSHQVTSI
jgi:tetratricopeptide (TPR) repeat protein